MTKIRDFIEMAASGNTDPDRLSEIASTLLAELAAEPVRGPDTLNAAQRVVADTYGGGDYAHITAPDEAEDVGDTLFTFLIRELADSEDCDDLDEALRRVEVARDQLGEIIEALADAANPLSTGEAA